MLKIPKDYGSTNKSVRVPNDLLQEMEEVIKNNNISFNELVVRCLRYAMENIDKSEDSN